MFSSMSRRLGFLAAGAGLAGVAGMAAGRSQSTRSVASDNLSGSVSRRILSLEAGDDMSAPYFRQDEGEHPVFVNIPNDGQSVVSSSPTLIEGADGIEIEGPYRPSSNYAEV